jgi:hypothetical protein
MQSEESGRRKPRYSLYSWLSENEPVAIRYEYGENPPEYIFEHEGYFYLLQPGMAEAEEISEVYGDRYQLLQNLCQSDISFVETNDLPDRIRKKIENGTVARREIHPSP